MERPSYTDLMERWAPVLNEESAGEIKDHYRKAVTAALLDNTEKALSESREATQFLAEAAPANNTNSAANWDPVLISLVRRSAPNLIAYDIASVQPMTGPTGLIFAMKSRYSGGSTSDSEAFFDEANTRFSGTRTIARADSSYGPSGLGGVTDSNGDSSIDDDRLADSTLHGAGMSTDSAEALGDSANNSFKEMGFTIEKSTVTAKSRALKAEYTVELAQDLRAIHGLDAETELANILSTEILAEINREIIRTVNSQAKTGATTANVATDGIFDLSTDADGRWSVEKFKGLFVQLDMEANTIAKETRRGKGNVVVCSSHVATTLNAAGYLDYKPSMNELDVDDTGNLYAGNIGKMKVFIDPYAVVDYVTIGYRGSSPYDAGLFYCPYVPLTMMRAVAEDSFQPKIGFKTRYGMASNPFVGATPADGLATAKTNMFYRIFRVANILV
jgi:hypothetical protein